MDGAGRLCGRRIIRLVKCRMDCRRLAFVQRIVFLQHPNLRNITKSHVKLYFISNSPGNLNCAASVGKVSPLSSRLS